MHRINAFVAQATGRARRECDEFVRAGRVTIDGRKAEFHDRVDEAADVRLDGIQVKPRHYDYLAFNKPTGILTAVRDKRGRTVCDLLPPRYRGVFPVGRLDRDSRGLVILTNDGAWAHLVQHPSHGVPKVYEVILDKPADIGRIAAGVELEDGWSHFVAARHASANGPTSGAAADIFRVELTLVEGRKRQIRRHLKALGWRVRDLVRARIGAITLGNLEPGTYRAIERAERESFH